MTHEEIFNYINRCVWAMCELPGCKDSIVERAGKKQLRVTLYGSTKEDTKEFRITVSEVTSKP